MEERQARLAWHETLELHEMVALQTTALMKCKLFVNEITDSALKHLYEQTISDLEQNLRSLMRFYPKAPRYESGQEMRLSMDDSFYASEMLAFAKVHVKCLAAAITETATHSLKEAFIGQLNKAIQCHTKVFNYMYSKGDYPAYDLPKLLDGDQKRAEEALNM